MSQISLKSISGITSITTPAGVDNVFTVHTNDTTEKFRVDQTGNQNISGIVTASNFKTGSSNLHSTGLTVGNNFLHSTGINVGTGATIHVPATNVLTLGTNSNERLRINSSGRLLIGTTTEGVANADDLTIATSGHTGITLRAGTTFQSAIYMSDATSGNGEYAGYVLYDHNVDALRFGANTSERLRIGSAGQIGIAGANYGTSGQALVSQGSGSSVAWQTITGTTINNNADNRLITGSGTANTLEGEANLTFTGSLLNVTGNIKFPDSTGPDYIGNIYVGDSNDLKIFHNGYDNFIRSGTNTNIRIDNNAGVLGARFIPAGAAELYHNGTKMCETSANGLAFPSGKGIDFSADGSGTLKSLPNSFNAEVLHDYENGTFTPNIQYDTGTNQYYGSPGSGHYVASSKGEYIRIGDMVWAAGEITLTGNRNSTQTVHISIGGMPYNGMHSSQQNSLQTGWGGAAWPKK